MAESISDRRREQSGENSEGWQEVGKRHSRDRPSPGLKGAEWQKPRQPTQQQKPRQQQSRRPPQQQEPGQRKHEQRRKQQHQHQQQRQHQQHQQHHQQQQHHRLASNDACHTTDDIPLANNRPSPPRFCPRTARSTSASNGSNQAARRGRDTARPKGPQQTTGRAARRECTLFDHIATNNNTNNRPSRASGFPPAEAQTEKGQRGGGKGKDLHPSETKRVQPPQRSTSSSVEEQRSRAAQHRDAATPGNRAGAFQEPGRGGVAPAVVVSGGGNGVGSPNGAVPLSRLSAARQSIHGVNGRAAIRNWETRKPGKQRLGPRKKKLSTLKKRILLDRLERWKATQQEGGPSFAEDGDGRHRGITTPPEALSPSLSAATCCGTTFTADKLCRGDGLEDDTRERAWVVVIHNLVDEEDIKDVDDHAEVERDLWEMASTFGAVCSVDVPRAEAAWAAKSGAAAAAARVVFETAEEAERARNGFHGRVVGGKALEVRVHALAGFLWHVAIDNLIDDEDDLEDDDEYAEVLDDVSAMMVAHGELVDVNIPRIGRRGKEEDVDQDGRRIGNESSTAAAVEEARTRAVVVTFGSLAEAKACVKGTKGRLVGGKELDAKLLTEPLPETSFVLARNGSKDKHTLGIDDGTVGLCTAPTSTSTGPLLSPSRSIRTPVATAATSSRWHVVIRNLIDADDLEDDDDYAELCSDTTTLASAYGVVSRLYVPRDHETAGDEAEFAGGGAQPGEAVAEFRSLGEAEACARGLKGRKLGGQVLDAMVMTPSASSRRGWEKGKEGGSSECSTPTDGKGGQGENARLLHQRQPMRTPPNHEEGERVGRDVVNTRGDYQRVETSEEGRNGGRRPKKVSTADQQRPHEAAATAAADMQPAAGLTRPVAATGGKRMPTKYKEAAALPKPQGVSGAGSPKAYVNQPPDQEANDLVFQMLQLLYKFQERVRLSDPAKAKTRRRIVMGLREVLRGVKAKKVQLLILAPNVDSAGGEGGLDDKVVELLAAAREQNTQVVFALSKRKIGKALGKTIKVSAVGVYSFDGAHEQHKQLKRRMEIISSSLPTTSIYDIDTGAEAGNIPPPASAASEDGKETAGK